MKKSITKKTSFQPIKLLLIAIPVLILLVIIIFLINRVPENPKGTVGNTAGNLYNSGLFCESGAAVYFSNPYDGGALYSMDIAENDITRLNKVKSQNILAAGDYLYFFQSNTTYSSGNQNSVVGSTKALNRCKTNGKSSVAIKTGVILGAQLVDNSLYVMLTDNEENSFLRLSTDGSEEKLLSNSYIHPGSAENGVIYYTHPNSHYLMALDTENIVPSELLAGNIWYPDKQGDYIYYIDADNNYSINRYSISQKTIEILTDKEERVDFYNVGNGYIYYQTSGSNPGLKFMYTDGTGKQLLASGTYHNINLTSTYAYFQEYRDDISLYHAPLGNAVYSEFTAAKDAVK